MSDTGGAGPYRVVRDDLEPSRLTVKMGEIFASGTYENNFDGLQSAELLASRLNAAHAAGAASSQHVTVRRDPLLASEVNALPERVRRYVADIETICDPAGMVTEIGALKDQRDALVVANAALTLRLQESEAAREAMRGALAEVHSFLTDDMSEEEWTKSGRAMIDRAASALALPAPDEMDRVRAQTLRQVEWIFQNDEHARGIDIVQYIHEEANRLERAASLGARPAGGTDGGK